MQGKPVRLGVIGMSDGNGHPYSWSAIFNGFAPGPMSKCPFPVIPEYLAAQPFPDAALPNAKVTHIWTQNREVSQHIADASLIPNVVNNITDLIGEVDGVLLARDDGERHVEMAMPFLEAGIPIYIDKPIALNQTDLKTLLLARKSPDMLFSCSALRFAKELQLSSQDREDIGDIQMVVATVMKSWEKYAVHIIEPVLEIIGHEREIISHSISGSKQHRTTQFIWNDGIETVFITTGNTLSPLKFSIFGSKGYKELQFSDSFNAFKEALRLFVDDYIIKKVASTPDNFYKTTVKVIESGIRSYA